MANPQVQVFAQAPDLFLGAAAAFTGTCLAAVAARGGCRVALAGGSTPRGLFRALAEQPRFPWGAVDWYWGDERHVPPEHPDSNYRMAREALFDAAPVAPGRIHPMPGGDPDAQAAALSYEAELRRAFPEPWPRFDLVLLGLGTDGHTASLFPGSPALAERERLVLAPWVERLGHHRLTLTLPVFNQAASILFLVSGADKAAMVAQVLGGGPPVPAQLIRPVAGELRWFLDAAAAG
jgi:6-phosphogluconolactonase